MEAVLRQTPIQLNRTEDYAQQSLEIVIAHLDEVNKLFNNCEFESISEEVKFYRYYKPKFVSRYFYFYRLAQYEIQKANKDAKKLRKYFRKERKRMLRFFKKHVDLIAHLQSPDSTDEHVLFTRKNCCESLCCEKLFLNRCNPRQSKNDLIVAEIMANEQLFIYVEKELNKLKPIEEQNLMKGNTFRWTGPKVALVELIYAMASSKMINNGDVDIKDLVRLFEQVFQHKIDAPYQVFNEIKARKYDQTKFLDQLRDALLQRISED